MALIGGGGAGNTAGGNPSGTGTGLNYVLDRCFAYSGAIAAVAGSATTALLFTTGSETIVGSFNLNAAVEYESANIAGTFIRINLNGEQAGIGVSGNGANDSPSSLVIDMVLAPFTLVEVETWADNNAASSFNNVQFTGLVL